MAPPNESRGARRFLFIVLSRCDSTFVRSFVRSFNALTGRAYRYDYVPPPPPSVPHPRVPRGQSDLSVDRIVENATVAPRETNLMLIPSATVTYRAAV